MSAAEKMLALHLDAYGIRYVREFRFHPSRRWRADFHVEPKLLIECEGAVYARGRHTRGAGFEADAEKYNAAVELGYTVLRYTPRQIKSGAAIDQIRRVARSG